jgi:hypothetical protein
MFYTILRFSDKFKAKKEKKSKMGDPGQDGKRFHPHVMWNCLAGHSTGKDMDCVAAFVLRRKTRPGMPCFE